MWQSGVILGFYLECAKSYGTPFLFGCHISFCCFFALEVMRGHDFWTHLKMCVIIFNLLSPILESGTGSGEMGSLVALMLMVIKFDPCDWGTLSNSVEFFS